MRVLQVSTSDLRGGAAIGAYRHHQGLRRIGVESFMLVRDKVSSDPTVLPWRYPDTRLGLWTFRARRAWWRRQLHAAQRGGPPGFDAFGDDRSAYGLSLPQQVRGYDLIHLQWVHDFLDYRCFFPHVPARVPVLWTLRDMAAMTGGCHYSEGCPRFQSGCGQCPQLARPEPGDLSARIWARKRAAFDATDPARLHIVTPSRWLAEEARRSRLLGRFPVTVIRNTVDTEEFHPLDKAAARAGLGLPATARIVLFVADTLETRRKGFALLVEALSGLRDEPNLHLLSVGRGQPLPEGVPQTHLGHVADTARLVAAYAAADVFVIPSLHDNLPKTVIEAMACATPVVGFRIGGIPDMVRPGLTGALAEPGDVAGLREAVRSLLADPARLASMGRACRDLAQRDYALETAARDLRDLYEKVLAQAGRRCDLA